MGTRACCIRRILGRNDRGEDVRRVQRALNLLLYNPGIVKPEIVDWKVLSERLTPELWGYCWAPGARKRHQAHPVDLFRFRRPQLRIPRDQRLVEDGILGPKTEAAIIKFQHKCGLPDDGIVWPETWDHLFPLWTVRMVLVEPKTSAIGMGQSPSVPDPESKAIETRQTRLDNIAGQLGAQLDKDGFSGVLVLQATWKTTRLPEEVLPGHWEHTGGTQVVVPFYSKSGKNFQVFYQISRAEILELQFSDMVKAALDVGLQPYVQVPLDDGTVENPNRTKAGLNAGPTVSVQLEHSGARPTMKIFLQGTVGVSVDVEGNVEKSWSAVGGLAVEVDVDRIFGKEQKAAASPKQAQGMQVDPEYLVLTPGGSSQVKVKLANSPQEPTPLRVQNLPPGVSASVSQVDKYMSTGSVTLTASSSAPASDRSDVTIQLLSLPGAKRIESASASIRVVVRP